MMNFTGIMLNSYKDIETQKKVHILFMFKMGNTNLENSRTCIILIFILLLNKIY